MNSGWKSRLALLLICVVYFASLSDGRRAKAAPVTVDVFFSGTEQDLVADVSAIGQLVTEGSGLFGEAPYVLDPSPQTDPAGLDPDNVTVGSDPVSLTHDAGFPPNPITTQFTFDNQTWDVLDITNLHLDLLSSPSATFDFDTVNIELLIDGTTPGTLDVDGEMVISDMSFWQDTLQSVTIDNQSGAVSVPGVVRFPFESSFTILNGSLLLAEYTDIEFEIPVDLLGTITTTAQGGANPQDVQLELDGAFDIALPIDLMEYFAADLGLASFTGTVDLQASVTVNFTYHLEALLEDLHGLLADISGDGRVDIGDFTLWGDAFGDTGAGLPADISQDGRVDIGDFTIWGDNFGNTLGVAAPGPATSAVPEPSAVTLLGIGILALIGIAWRRRA